MASLDKQHKEFESKLRFEGYSLVKKNLKAPRTVCTHKGCVKPHHYVSVGINNEKIPTYQQHCHTNCQLGGSVIPEVIGDDRLQGNLNLATDFY